MASASTPVTDPTLPPRDGAPEDAAPDAVADAPVASEPAPVHEGPPEDGSPVEPAPAAPDEPQATPIPVTPPGPRDQTVMTTVAAFVVGCLLVVAGYVAINGAALLAAAAPKSYEAAKMSVPRGVGRLQPDGLAAQGVGNDVLIVAVATDFRARDLETIDWDVSGLPADADVRLLFNSDYTPRRVHNRPLAIEDGRLRPIAMTGDRDWLGRITGLAIAVRAGGEPIRVRSVTAKPLSLTQLLADRAREWFRFEPWTGTSINSVTGGASSQNLPLAIPVAIAALLALGIVVLLRRLLPSRYPRGIASIAVLVFVVAWLVLDVRWTANLARQAFATIERYGGRDAAARLLAAEDGELVAFIDKAKALMPGDPQRILVMSDAHYFRGRAGWHLFPHRVAWEPVRDVPPSPGMLKSGDYVLVWRRPGAQFDAGKGRVRFDNGVELPATMLLVERGSALFAIR